MNFKFSNFITLFKSKWFRLIVFFIAIIGIIVSEFFFHMESEIILILVTMFYVFFTYEILRATRENKDAPWIDVEFLMCSKLDKGFLREYEQEIIKDEKYNILYKEYKNNPRSINKNFVFVQLKNVGRVNALSANLFIEYEMRNLGRTNEKSPSPINFGMLENGDRSIKLLEIYDSPQSEDYFKIKKGCVKFYDVTRSLSKESPMKNDFSKSAKSRKLDQNVKISFKQ